MQLELFSCDKKFCKNSSASPSKSPLCICSTLNSPELRSILNSPLPLRFVRYDILFAHFRGIKCLPPLPTLPYPQEATMWLPAENSPVALAAHFTAEKESLHSRIEIFHSRIEIFAASKALGRPQERGNTDLAGDKRMLVGFPFPWKWVRLGNAHSESLTMPCLTPLRAVQRRTQASFSRL